MSYGPAIGIALGIVLLGWLAGRLARGSSHHLANYVNRILDRMLRRGSLATARVPTGVIALMGEILFWAVFLFSIVIAARVAGITIFAVWLDKAVTHFPHLVIGFAILNGLAIAVTCGLGVYLWSRHTGHTHPPWPGPRDFLLHHPDDGYRCGGILRISRNCHHAARLPLSAV